MLKYHKKNISVNNSSYNRRDGS